MNIIQKLTIRSLIMNKSRTIMTIAAIMLAAALITAVAGIGTSAYQSLIYANVNNYGDYDVSFSGEFSQDTVEKIKLNRDVAGVYYNIPVGTAKVETNSKYRPYTIVKAMSPKALGECCDILPHL